MYPALRGSGRIEWTATSGIRLQGVTNGAQAINALYSQCSSTPGQLIPRSTYYTFGGRTQYGWEFSADPAPRGGERIHSDMPEVVWDRKVPGVTLSQESPSEKYNLLRILMGPVPDVWPHTCERAESR